MQARQVILGPSREAKVEAAVQDLWARTLANMPCNLSRLVYLASTRDYNSFDYYHDGLAMNFSQDAANEALAKCHAMVFRELVLAGVRELTKDVKKYMMSSQIGSETFLKAWSAIEPFAVLVPAGSNPVAIRIFISNVRVALVILGESQQFRSSLLNALPQQ